MIKESIGIGITTHNRYEVFKKSYDEIVRFSPNAKIVVVDDASDIPVREATFRFDENVGIATAKNKCLELLEGCDHIFLFDDDTYPKKKGWEKPYIESKEPHLMYMFEQFANATEGRKLNDCEELYRDSGVVAYSHARGCMLYVKKIVLDVVGGFDTNFGKAMFEHSNWTDRIFNAGLTTFRIMDVPNSSDLIYSSDEYQEVKSSIDSVDRRKNFKVNETLYKSNISKSYYYPYKPPTLKKNAKNLIITCYFNTNVDTQRNKHLEADYAAVKKLADSINGRENLLIISDCFDQKDYGTIKHLKVEAPLNPYFQRWLSTYQYLKEHPEIDYVFCVDATDVEMLNSPFEHLDPDKIYCGDELEVTGNNWMRRHSRHEPLTSFIRRNGRSTLINCGIVGGSREDVMGICRGVYSRYLDWKKVDLVEMPIFNFVIKLFYKDKLVHGYPVNTRFKKEEYVDGAWFKHK